MVPLLSLDCLKVCIPALTYRLRVLLGWKASIPSNYLTEGSSELGELLCLPRLRPRS